jgi:hypothetical protein
MPTRTLDATASTLGHTTKYTLHCRNGLRESFPTVVVATFESVFYNSTTQSG